MQFLINGNFVKQIVSTVVHLVELSDKSQNALIFQEELDIKVQPLTYLKSNHIYQRLNKVS